MRKNRLPMIVGAMAVFLLTLAGPASAHHDHQLNNPGGCHTILVGHQAHTADDPGNKFHGAAHYGAATGVTEGAAVLGKGNSAVSVAGGPCPT